MVVKSSRSRLVAEVRSVMPSPHATGLSALHCVYVSSTDATDVTSKHWTWAFREVFRRPLSGIARPELLADPLARADATIRNGALITKSEAIAHGGPWSAPRDRRRHRSPAPRSAAPHARRSTSTPSVGCSRIRDRRDCAAARTSPPLTGFGAVPSVIHHRLGSTVWAQKRSARLVSLATYAGQSCCPGRLETSASSPAWPSTFSRKMSACPTCRDR